MKKILLIQLLCFASASFILAQSTTPINAEKMAVFTVPASNTSDTLAPYYEDLGVRRVLVADADGDGDQEILATDYSNGGRVHVMEVAGDSLLEIVWSSPAEEWGNPGSTPRFIQVGDCDGDGNNEIIFPQSSSNNIDGSTGRYVLYEWNGSDWGNEPAFVITPNKLTAAGLRDGEVTRFNNEVLTVFDIDNDGRSEIISSGTKDVIILGVTFSFPGFAGISIDGGKPGSQTNGGDWGVGGTFRNAIPADIDGDGELEIVNHIYNNYGFWSIDVKGDSYIYPEATSNADARAKGVYNEFTQTDDVSYFGARAADVNGDGRDEIVGSQVTTGVWSAHRIAMNSFSEADTGVYVWNNDPTYVSEHYNIIVPNVDIAALAGWEVAGLWPIVKGDLNKDGKDELYTGGGSGLNLVAIQYNGLSDLLDPASYDVNLVYSGEGGQVYKTWKINRGHFSLDLDSTYIGDSLVVDTLNVVFEPSIIDTSKLETPFTSYIFADNVDLDNDGKLEIVIAEQSVYDSISVNFYDWVFNDSSNIELGWREELNRQDSYKIFNEYRQSVRVLEYNDGPVGFREKLYGIISPDDYKLEQNYPNPFNPTTTVNFSLPIDKKISLKVYDMVGQEIKTLINGLDLKKGSHQVIWDGTNNFGSKVASGNYVAKLSFGNFVKSIKMTLLK